MNAQQFGAFLQKQRAKIAQAFQEVEQVQIEYQGAYTRFKADHDRTLRSLADVRGEPLPDPLPSQVTERVPQERQAIVDRIAALDSELREQRRLADLKAGRMQKQMADLRALNPQLNEREESLKAMIAFRQQKLHDLNAQVSSLGGGLGFLVNIGRINALDNERQRLVGQLQALDEDVAKVRQEWQTKREEAAAAQAQEQSEWQAIASRVGALQEERDHLTANIDSLAKQRAILYVLDNLKSLASADAELQQMIALNIQTDEYQAALGSVAGILGVLKGMDEGMARFSQSVAALADEHSRHSQYLSPPSFEVPAVVSDFGAVWDDLAARTRDEKTLARHPAQFVTAMQPFLQERFSKDRISAYFGALNDALQRATRGWKGVKTRR